MAFQLDHNWGTITSAELQSHLAAFSKFQTLGERQFCGVKSTLQNHSQLMSWSYVDNMGMIPFCHLIPSVSVQFANLHYHV